MENSCEEILISVAVENWRFAKLFIRAISKLEHSAANRYSNQLRYHLINIEDSLGKVGLRVVNLEGQPYDVGMAATPLNIDEFESADTLCVDYMTEPIIMGHDGIKRQGSLMLKKANL